MTAFSNLIILNEEKHLAFCSEEDPLGELV